MKIIKIVITLLLVILLISCTRDNNLEETYEISSVTKILQSDLDLSPADASSAEDSSTVSVPIVNNQATYEQLITKTVDIHEIVEKYFIEINTADNFYDINADMGIECLRQNDSGTYYSVNKVKQGGLLYIFYPNIPQHEDYKPIIKWFYVLKNLSYSDFNSVNEGDSIEDVKYIDPTTQIFINIYNADPDFWNDIARGFISYHYLNDGVLYISYKNKDGKIFVSDKNFINDFTIELFGETSTYYDGRILPIDRID